MKLVLNLSLTVLALLSVYDKTFALTNYQINKICKKEKRVSNCVKSLKDKRDNLQRGNLIEIQVIPYKR